MAIVRSGSTDRAAALAALEGEGLYVFEWTDSPGVHYPEHEHAGREVRLVLEGTMTLGTPSGEHELGAGDRIDLEPGERHWARVGPDGVRYLAATSRKPGVQ